MTLIEKELDKVRNIEDAKNTNASFVSFVS